MQIYHLAKNNGLNQYIPGVHDQPAEEVRPCDVIHSILLGSNSSCSYLCIQVISQNPKQATTE